MKTILVALLVLTSFTGFSQHSILNGQVIDSQSHEGFAGVTILFKQADTVVTGATTNQKGEFSIESIPIGVYDIAIQAIGYRSEKLTNVAVSNATPKLTIPFPGPCKYIYSKGKRPSCIGGHTDHIVPIVYGLPNKRTMRKAEKEQLYLGGCQLTGCDPHYYCLVHKVEL